MNQNSKEVLENMQLPLVRLLYQSCGSNWLQVLAVIGSVLMKAIQIENQTPDIEKAFDILFDEKCLTVTLEDK